MSDKPCAGCPWTSKAERDRAALTDEVKAAAVAGRWFCCHVNMGTCHGAERYGKAKRQTRARDPIAESLERDNQYWIANGGRTDGVTDAVGWNERYQQVLREAPK